MTQLLLINGVSGVGKTSAASVLREEIAESSWIHPDRLWDTPNMGSRRILEAALDRLGWQDSARVSIIDCQIRGSEAREIVACRMARDQERGAAQAAPATWIANLLNVLLVCGRQERERRLRERSSDRHDLDRIEAWSNVLREDAIECGDPIIDTTSQDVESVALEIRRILDTRVSSGTQRTSGRKSP